MAVVIRLQGLRVTAGSEDIRSFFTGLRIPDGGVHIIGGELEEAFIIFVSDEDARRAMSRSGGCIKGSPVNLLLSSKTEMQKVLEESTRKAEANNNNRRIYKEGVKRPPAADGRPPPMNEDLRVDMRRGEPFQDSQNQMGKDDVGFYLHLSGMPFAASLEDVQMFFEGLQVEDVIFLNNRYGMFNGICLVKFATTMDARKGLKLDRKYMGSRYICIKICSEDQWVNAGGFVQPDQKKRAPVRTRSRSPVRSRSRSPSDEEFCVLYKNLSASVQKQDIKALLQHVFLKDDQIIIFTEQNRENTHSAVVVFRNLNDYCSGLAHHKETFLNRVVYASPISKEKMKALLETSTQLRDARRSSRSSDRSQKSSHDSEKRCLYVRNLPFDIRKAEIMDFFHEFKLSEGTIILLHDERGKGLGEVLIVFQTEEEATMAQSLNGQRFLGSEVILKCITLGQMQEAFGVSNEIVERSIQRNPGRQSDPSPRSYDQMHEGDRDVMPDRHYFGQGNSSQFDSFENTDFYAQGTQWSGPQQYGPSDQQFDRPTCLKLLNLPSQIRIDEIYDFCYGHRVIPGSVSLQYDRNGVSATVVFETHREAFTAIKELNGRPIGTRKIKIVFV